AISWQFDFYIACTRFIHTIISCWIICHVVLYRTIKSPLIAVLSNTLLINIGKVSYGIYLYHMLYVYLAGDLWYKYVSGNFLRLIDKKFELWTFVFINFWMLYFISWL